MLTSKIQELSQYKAKIAELERTILAERAAQLARLHTDLGFASRAELISALRAEDKAPGGRKRGRKAAVARSAGKKPRRKRTKITPELRSQIEAAIRTGATGAAVANQFGISLPTVHNIKKAAGLTRKRGQAASAG